MRIPKDENSIMVAVFMPETLCGSFESLFDVWKVKNGHQKQEVLLLEVMKAGLNYFELLKNSDKPPIIITFTTKDRDKSVQKNFYADKEMKDSILLAKSYYQDSSVRKMTQRDTVTQLCALGTAYMKEMNKKEELKNSPKS